MKDVLILILLIFSFLKATPINSQNVSKIDKTLVYIERCKEEIKKNEFYKAKIYIDKAIELIRAEDESLLLTSFLLKSKTLLHIDSLYEAELLIDSTFNYIENSGLKDDNKEYGKLAAYHLQGLIFKAGYDYERAELSLLECYANKKYNKSPWATFDLCEIYLDQGFYEASLKLAKEIEFLTDDLFLITKAKIVQGLCLANKGQIKGAKKIERSVSLSKTFSNFQQSESYKLLGDLSQLISNPDSSIVFYNTALKKLIGIQAKELKFEIYKGIVKNYKNEYLQKKELPILDSISFYADKALRIKGNTKLYDLINIRGNLVEVNIIKQDSLALAEDISPFLDEKIISILNHSEKAEAFKTLSLYYESKRDIETAYKYTKSASTLKDSIRYQDKRRLELVNQNLLSFSNQNESGMSKQSWLQSLILRYIPLIVLFFIFTGCLIIFTYQKRKKLKAQIEEERKNMAIEREEMKKKMDEIVEENIELSEIKENPIYQLKGYLDLPGTRRVDYEDIIKITTIKGQKGNIQIHTTNSTDHIPVKSSITIFANKLPSPLFMRTSPGSIVNTSKIKEKPQGRKTLILADGSTIKVTHKYRKALFEELQKDRIT